MNHALLKQKMDKFFNDTSSESLVSEFEALGCRFVESEIAYNFPEGYQTIYLARNSSKTSIWNNLLNKFSNTEKNQDLNKFEVFLCNLVS